PPVCVQGITEDLTGVDIPQPELALSGGGEERAPVGAEPDVARAAGVTGELFELAAARNVPDRDALVVGRGRQPRAVGTERDAPGRVLVRDDVCPRPARLRLP